jgi:hypothetical protein
LRQAQLQQARISSSPEARELLRAQQDFSEAQTFATRARLGVERLNGPDPARLAAANRTVERAEATLRALRVEAASRGAPSAVPARLPAIASAEQAARDAIARREQILAGPSPQEIEAARRADAQAKRAFEAAAQRLELARQAQGPVSIAEADAAVLAAQTAVYNAEARVQALQSGRE